MGPHMYRLTKQAMAEHGVTHKRISAQSQRVEHWLGLGDIWLALTFAGGRPGDWRTEWDAQFDAYCIWSGKPYLIEYQRTPITKQQWEAKWKKRRKWFGEQEWKEKPRVVLIATCNQNEDTMRIPKGTIVVRRIEDLPREIRRHNLSIHA